MKAAFPKRFSPAQRAILNIIARNLPHNRPDLKMMAPLAYSEKKSLLQQLPDRVVCVSDLLDEVSRACLEY